MEQLKSISRNAWLGLGFVAVAVLLAFFSVAAATVFVCATILVVIYPRIDTVIEFSFGPLTAKLERTITKSELILDSLQKLSVVQAKLGLNSAIRVGRLHHGAEWIFPLMKGIDALLSEIGVDTTIRSEVRKDIVDYTIHDLALAALGGNSWSHRGVHPDAIKEWSALRAKPGFLTAEDVDAFLTKWNLMTPERQIMIDDMRAIRESGDIRDVATLERLRNAD